MQSSYKECLYSDTSQIQSSISQTINNNSQQQYSIQSSLQTITFKIKDSLYISSSVEAFQDEQFVLLNWIQHIVVFQNKDHPFDPQLKNLYGQEGDKIIDEDQECIKYLHCDETLFKPSSFVQKNVLTKRQLNKHHEIEQSPIKQLSGRTVDSVQNITSNFQSIYNFIEQAQEQGTSCLLLASSPQGTIHDTGCLFAICSAYLMRKYQWSLYKTLQYMNSRVKDAQITEAAYQFLNQLEISLLSSSTLTYNWQSYQSSQELVLRNTFLNSQKIICENHSQKTHSNNLSVSRQKIKIKSKFENPQRKLKTQTALRQKSLLKPSSIAQLRPILKESNKKQKSLNCFQSQKNRIEINLSLNQVKQYENLLSHNQIYIKPQTKEKQSNSENLTPIKNQSNFPTPSRSKRISLCVNQIVSKFREDKKSQNRDSNNIKSLCFDDFYQMNLKGMKKKKSFYNFDPCQQNSKFQSQEKKKKDNDEISKIVNKIKSQKQKQKSKGIQLSNQKENPITNRIFDNVKIHTESNNQQTDSRKKSAKRQNAQFNNEKRTMKHSLTDRMTNENIFTEQKQSWLNIIKNKKSLPKMQQKNMKDSKNYGDHSPLPKNKHSSQVKKKKDEKQNSRIYIKEVKKTVLTQRKQSMNENADLRQKNREKNLMIEYEDFKEMIKNKQKSIGNLLSHSKDINNQKQINENREKISSVVEKLKKDVFQMQLNSKAQINLLKQVKSKNVQKIATQKLLDSKQWR